MKHTLKILIADDCAFIRSGLRFVLENKFSERPVFSEASHGLEVLDLIATQKFDILLLDIEMPKLDGIATLKRFRAKNEQLPVLVFSSHDEINHVKQIIDLGAQGFLKKGIGTEEMVKAIETVLDGGCYYSNEITQIILGAERKPANAIGLDINLTKRELQILKLLAEDLSTHEIAGILKINYRTVEGHRTNLKSKLGVRSSIGLVRHAYNCGLLN